MESGVSITEASDRKQANIWDSFVLLWYITSKEILNLETTGQKLKEKQKFKPGKEIAKWLFLYELGYFGLVKWHFRTLSLWETGENGGDEASVDFSFS